MARCKHCRREFEDDHFCTKAERRVYAEECPSGDFATSLVVGAVTGSAIAGVIVGGDIGGAIVGDMLDGDLFD